MSPKQKDGSDTEKGFGTGLREQLERRRDPSSTDSDSAQSEIAQDSAPETAVRPQDDAQSETGMSPTAVSASRAQTEAERPQPLREDKPDPAISPADSSYAEGDAGNEKHRATAMLPWTRR